MAQVEFQHNETNTLIQCQKDDKIEDICNKYLTESKINSNEIEFFYNGKKLVEEYLTFDQLANPVDKTRKKMDIIIMGKNLSFDNTIVQSKLVICPNCREAIKMNINNYKINLFDCRNNHINNNILLKEFKNYQLVNLSKIICDTCKENNISNAKNDEFYKCIDCNINLCSLCKAQHNNEHHIINYNKANYICQKHNTSFNKYCKDCKLNLCEKCQEEHKNHELISYEKMIIDKKSLSDKLSELKKSKDTLDQNINKIIEIINNYKENIDNFYDIEEYIINNYDPKEINYEILYNISEIINYNEIILKDINIINNENKPEEQFNKIVSMSNQNNTSENNEIKLSVKITKEDVNKQIYFLDNTDRDLYINGKWEKHCHDFLTELNESNVELYIENNRCEYKKYFVPEKEGIYHIILKFNIFMKDCGFMFYNCKNITSMDLSLFDTKNITNMGGMFYGCSNLSNIDVSLFNTKNVTNMGGMFYNCSNLKIIDLGKFDTKNVTEMGGMFLGCSNLEKINLSSFDTKNVTDMNGMFYNCFNLTSIELKSFDTKNVTNMSYMFYKCSNLVNIELTSFNTENVVNMESMFYNCSNVKSMDLSSFDTKNVTNMSYMFNKCTNLSSLDLSLFNTKNVDNMGGIFDGCSKLVSIKLNKKSYEKLRFYINKDDTNIIFS